METLQLCTLCIPCKYSRITADKVSMLIPCRTQTAANMNVNRHKVSRVPHDGSMSVICIISYLSIHAKSTHFTVHEYFASGS